MARRASGNYLLRLSITLMVIGYGSVLLNFTEIQFTVLEWAHSMQPWIGLIIGTIGLGILLVPLILARRGGSVSPGLPFQQSSGFAPAPQQSYGTPAQGFPQQQGFGQQGFAPQHGTPQQGFPQQPAAQQGFAPQGFAPQTGPQPGFASQTGPQPGFAPQTGAQQAFPQQSFPQSGAQQPFPPQGPPQQFGQQFPPQQSPFPPQGYGPQQ